MCVCVCVHVSQKDLKKEKERKIIIIISSYHAKEINNKRTLRWLQNHLILWHFKVTSKWISHASDVMIIRTLAAKILLLDMNLANEIPEVYITILVLKFQ